MSLIFGNLVQVFVNFTIALNDLDPNNPETKTNLDETARKFRKVAAQDASYLTYIGASFITLLRFKIINCYCSCLGVGLFVCTYIYMAIWVYTSEATAKRIRELYLKAVLRQDVAFFDNVGAGEITTRIQTDTRSWSLSHLSAREFLRMPSCARLDPPGFIGKGCPRSLLLRCICYWLCLGIRKELATCSRYVVHLALHCHYWRHYE